MLGLLQFRRKNPGQVWAWATYDFANSAFATTILAVIFNTYYAGIVAGGQRGIMLWGTRVPGATMFSMFVALSMVLIGATSPILGTLADVTGRKRSLLGIHLAAGVIATALLATVGPGQWLWGGMLFLVAQVGFAGGNVFYNAMLYDIADEEDFGKVSGLGWAWGYVGGGLLLAINLIMLRFPQWIGFPEHFFTVQHCFFSVAIWWAIFSIPILRAVPDRRTGSLKNLWQQTRSALRRLKVVVSRLHKLPDFTRFFFAFLLYNDAIETVIVMASIFASQELGFSSTEIIAFFLMVQGIAFFGSLMFGWLADILGDRRTVIISLVGWLIVIIWAWKLGIFGNAHTEYWLLGVLTAIVMGGSQAASRSLQATLIPPERSAEFFSFFGISGKFASAVGPLIFGLAVMITGSLRAGILSLVALFGSGLLLLFLVNEERGRAQAATFDEES